MAASPPQHVLDLPPLYTRPSYDTLLIVLQQLASGLTNFNPSSNRDETDHISLDGLPRYLTSIVSNSLIWIEDEAQKEEIWELASKRISERAGRAAAPSAYRTFTIPLPQRPHGTVTKPIQITLHEPSLTEDNLGHKTWAASYLLATHLPSILQLLPKPPTTSPPQSILELGSGTGLLGLTYAALTSTHVQLTDLPAIIPNLARNIDLNAENLSSHGGSAQAEALDWSLAPSLNPTPKNLENSDNNSSTSTAAERDHQFQSRKATLILTSDPIYSPSHPEILVNTIVACLSLDPNSRVISGLPLREGYEVERADFERRMGEAGLDVVDNGVITGYGDDWGNGDEEVRVKWCVWRWREVGTGDEVPKEWKRGFELLNLRDHMQ